MLTETCLPALLAPGNIPALTAEWPARFIIYTRAEDIHRITDSPNYARLAAVLPVEFKTIDAELLADKYSALTRIHHGVLGTALYEHAAIVWLVPDAIWGDGSLRTVSRAAAAGKRAVMQPALRVVKDDAMPVVRDLLAGRECDGFKPRDLVRIAIGHMHPYYRACYWNDPQFNTNPPLVFWGVGDEGVLARGFHLHPLMLFPSKQVHAFTSTFDDDLPLLVCPDLEAIHVVTDSDDAFHIDLTEEDWCKMIPRRTAPATAFFLSRFALQATNLHHRQFARTPIRIHAVECSEAWREAERDSHVAVMWMRFWIAVSGVARLPVELAFGHLRSRYLSGRPVHWKDRTAASRPGRIYYWMRRQAYMCACGWVFGHNVACRRVGLDPWRERRWGAKLLEFYFQRIFLPFIAPVLLWWINWWGLKKKRARNRLRWLRGRTAKTADRQVRLARHRLDKGRRAVLRAWGASGFAGSLAVLTKEVLDARERSAARVGRVRSSLRQGLDLRGPRRTLRRALSPRSLVRTAERTGSKVVKHWSRTVRRAYRRARGLAAGLIHPGRH